EVEFFCCFSFFFSSGRRHTRSKRDWSSDVCSSDLSCRTSRSSVPGTLDLLVLQLDGAVLVGQLGGLLVQLGVLAAQLLLLALQRSEERRVGKERRGGRAAGG